MKLRLPDYVEKVMKLLTEAGFEAYVVGGAVRDLLLDKEPDDYDVVTNARPDEIKILAAEHGLSTAGELGQNFGVVLLVIGKKTVEVASYRNEIYGSDAHRPEEVWYCDTLGEDLGRRDFTINAMAVGINGELVDLYEGQEDLRRKIIRTVGNADKRFDEDALRMFRACRFVAQLGFSYDKKIFKAIGRNLERVQELSLERVRTELNKLMCGAYADKGMELLVASGLAAVSCRVRKSGRQETVPILPELMAVVNVPQNPDFHQYDVWQHTLKALANGDRSLEVSWGILLHDIAKGREGIRGISEDGQPTDYGHEIAGAKMAEHILTRLQFPKATVTRISWLVLNHMRFGINTDMADNVTWRWLRKTAREGPFRVTKEMAEAFKQLTALCIADMAATVAAKQELISAQMYGKRLVTMAYQMPVHTSDLNIKGEDLADFITNKQSLAEIMPILLRRVQDGSLTNEPAALKMAARGWQQRQSRNRAEGEINV